VNEQEAYRRCEAITRRQAANFYYGIRLLSPERRSAMCAVYAFARRVDDIGDGSLAHERKLALLDEQASALAALSGADQGGSGVASQHDPVLVALADVYTRFPVPPDAMRELIAGVRMDVEGLAYETFDELVRYCRRVAGAIGRACLAIFALRDPAAAERAGAYRLADDLGVALQLTNILRDIREDALLGRVYLPAEDLRRFGLLAAGEERGAARTIVALAGARGAGANAGSPSVAARDAADDAGWLDALVRFQAARAREWFDRGLTLAPLLDRRSAAGLLAMAGIYSRLLERIEAEPDRVLRERVSVPAHEKALVAVKGMLGVRA
jgi:15-cis-phytoene synthase